MIKKEWRSLFKNKFMLAALAAIILIPSIYTTIFLGSMWDPYGKVDHLPVAIVNNDEAAEYNGKTLNIGEELVDSLKENNSLKFTFTNQESADEGLENGTYYMVINIHKSEKCVRCEADERIILAALAVPMSHVP